MNQAYATLMKKKSNIEFKSGIAMTLGLALIAKYLSHFPFLSIMGQLVIALLLGMGWRALFGIPRQAMTGIKFSSTRLLRYGIILLGMRLNLADIARTGPKVLTIAVIAITFTLFTVYGITRLFKVEKRLGILTACGTAICGAAAVVAISPQIKANDDGTAVGAATVAILGTIFTLSYTMLYPVLGLSNAQYGIFSGATLHEVAHVIAAASPGGNEAVDIAVMVKLTRVAMLVPVAIIIGAWTNKTQRNEDGKLEKASWRSIPIPWFIFGFLAMSGVNTLGIIPGSIANQVVLAAYLLIAMAMAGLGLNVDIRTFRRLGVKPFAAGLIGSLLLSGLGFMLVA
ncbi:hypothetical protein B1748_19000 [Paenibacillus sp. MY03]|uniref:YeiH family protein n=1 Tax=Paenibacillus sp. MY03 TaxID=302980 RepID=UPI000B3D3519|nr:YeiH family protein [Paenibacillus sp. MY03]OUS75223.1 hypothetical protein B1748_19000 [Paenibacillus sp. MY03]